MTLWDIGGAVIFAPLVEAWALAAVYRPLSSKLPRMAAAGCAATLLSAFHAWFDLAWAATVLPPLLVFALPFPLQEKMRRATMMSALIHAWHNGFALLATAFTLG